MKLLIASVLLAFPWAATLCSLSQSPSTHPDEYRPGVGTIIVTELANSVNAKRAKVGDRVECTVTQDLLFQGRIAVPRFSRVVGQVTEAQASTKEHRESRLGLSFDRILLKGKKELMFQSPAVVVALAPPMRTIVQTATKLNDLPLQMEKGGVSTGGGSAASSTGKSVMDAISNNPNIVGANMVSTSGAIDGANRGVISWPGVFLLKGAPGSSVIASPRENVELVYQTQMVLRILEPAK